MTIKVNEVLCTKAKTGIDLGRLVNMRQTGRYLSRSLNSLKMFYLTSSVLRICKRMHIQTEKTLGGRLSSMIVPQGRSRGFEPAFKENTERRKTKLRKGEEMG